MAFGEMKYSSSKVSENCQSRSWHSRAPAIVTDFVLAGMVDCLLFHSELVSPEVMVSWVLRESSEVGKANVFVPPFC